jgi:hypothetical protein
VHDYHRGLMLVPYDPIMVELVEGPIFTSNPAEFAYADMSYIMLIEVRLIDPEDAGGSFKLPVFRKARPKQAYGALGL